MRLEVKANVYTSGMLSTGFQQRCRSIDNGW